MIIAAVRWTVASLAIALIAPTIGCGRIDYVPRARGDAEPDAEPCVLRSPCGGACLDMAPCATPCEAPRTCGGGGTAGVCGAAFFVAASGGSDTNTGLAREQAWATFARAFGDLRPGDALVLLDGTYTEPLAPQLSGTDGAPIRFCSDTDGGAVLDGEGVRTPCEINGGDTTPLSHLTLEGLVCRRSIAESVLVSDAHHITVRRVSAYEAAPSSAAMRAYQVQDSLFEDVAAAGPGDFALHVIATSRVTVRRAYARWESSPTVYGAAIAVSWASDNTLEDCVATAGPSPENHVTGVAVYVASRNVVRGTIAHAEGTGELDLGFGVSSATERTSGNRIVGSAAIRAVTGLFQRSDDDLVVDRLTLVDATEKAISVSPTTEEPKEAGFALRAVIRSSVLLRANEGIVVGGSPYIGTIAHHHNDLFGVTTPYYGTAADPTELAVDPAYDLARYGTGGYAIAPRALATAGAAGGPIGAEILYRHRDGVLTTEPLWPWPMEERILRETGRSVTWQSNGGLFTTLDGVYP